MTHQLTVGQAILLQGLWCGVCENVSQTADISVADVAAAAVIEDIIATTFVFSPKRPHWVVDIVQHPLMLLIRDAMKDTPIGKTLSGNDTMMDHLPSHMRDDAYRMWDEMLKLYE